MALHTPAYYPFFSMVERADRSAVEVPAKRDADGIYRIDVDGVDRAFGEGAGSLVLCNPWNPTGRSLSASEIEEVVAVVASHGGRIISDEIHAVLTYEGAEHVPVASVDPETVVTVTLASKAWNLPGLKCAQVVLTNDADIAPWSDYFTFEKRVAVGTFGLVASAAAYDGGEAFLNEVMVRLEGNRKLLGALIAAHLPGVEYTPHRRQPISPGSTSGRTGWRCLPSFCWSMPVSRCPKGLPSVRVVRAMPVSTSPHPHRSSPRSSNGSAQRCNDRRPAQARS